MLQALNVISVQALVYRGQERIRRVQEIVEIAGADPVTGSLRVNTVFTYDPVTDRLVIMAVHRSMQILHKNVGGVASNSRTRSGSGR